MEPKNFFRFDSKVSSSTIQAYIQDDTIDHIKLIRGEYEGIKFPILFKHEYGSKFKDVLDTGRVNFFLISEKFKNILQENKLTGWKVYPIKLVDKKGNEIFGYHGLSVTGRCGSITYNKSKIIQKKLVPNGPLVKFYKGIFINEWDTNDFFCPSDRYQIFLNANAANILTARGISNLSLIDLADYEIDVLFVKK